MNIQVPVIQDADDFLLWNEGRAGRREFVSGRIVEMMTGGSLRHAELTSQLLFVLKSRLAEGRLTAVAADFAVRTPLGVRYPDVLVVERGGPPRSLATSEPLLVAEILSPSTLAVDFGEKAEEYTAIPSLLHYVVLSQDEPRVWLWRRGEAGGFERPEMIAGAEETLPLPGLDLAIPLAGVYRGLA